MKWYFAFFIIFISQNTLAGYDVHITHKENWFDENEICINKSDWKQYLDHDSTIQNDLDNGIGNYLVYINKNEYSMWFDYKNCDLGTKNPNAELLGKFIEIAKALNAKVQGDDGEIYITPEKFYYKEE